MSTATQTKPASTKKAPLVPPDERMWKRYSKHGEFPWSTSLSIALHGFGLLALLFLIPWLGEFLPNNPTPPPKMDLLEIEGLSGGGDEMGAGLKKLGEGNQPQKTEGAGNASNATKPNEARPKAEQVARLDNLKFDPKLGVNSNAEFELDEGNLPFKQLEKLSKDAAKDLKDSLEQPLPGSKLGTSQTPGTGSPGGDGTGRGKGKGPGTGDSKTGVVYTRKMKHEARWQILASPDGNIHLKKLAALGITLAVPTSTRGKFAVYDLSKLPPVSRQMDLSGQKEKVMWINGDPRELAGLASVLGLKSPPPFAAIFLPQGLEDRMAELEAAYISQNNRAEREIEKTYWDVPQRDGVYDNEPTIVHQKVRGAR